MNNSSLNYRNMIMIALLCAFLPSCYSQKIKNKKTETVHISGNCGMCEKTIETAGNLKKIAVVDWDKETKMATLTYDSLKTSKSEILKRVALSGYDNDLFVAPDDTYANLPNCCQYERMKKETVKEMEVMNMTETHIEHSMPESIEVEETVSSEEVVKNDNLQPVFSHYFQLKNALIESDATLSASKAKELSTALEKVEMDKLEMDVHMQWMKVMNDLKSESKQIAESKDIETQRVNFIALSENMYSLLKVAKYEQSVYYQHCPMANDGKGANWLSTESAVKNPYYGSAMLSCGKTVETIE